MARLDRPTYLALDAAGNLYIADSGNDRIRRVDGHGVITTVAGGGKAVVRDDGRPRSATAVAVGGVRGLAADATGNIYIAEVGRVRRVNAAGTITTVAGNPDLFRHATTAAQLSLDLRGLAVDGDGAGNLYIADAGNRQLVRIDPAGGVTYMPLSDPSRDGEVALDIRGIMRRRQPAMQARYKESSSRLL